MKQRQRPLRIVGGEVSGECGKRLGEVLPWCTRRRGVGHVEQQGFPPARRHLLV
jgi:hypothetical protein